MTYQVVSEVVARCIAVMAPPAVDLIVPEPHEIDISAFYSLFRFCLTRKERGEYIAQTKPRHHQKCNRQPLGGC